MGSSKSSPAPPFMHTTLNGTRREGNMASRRTSPLLIAAVCALALWGLSTCFVPAPSAVERSSQRALRGEQSQQQWREEAILGAAALASMPEAAHAANNGYAIPQLGWSIFIIGLGPAVLF